MSTTPNQKDLLAKKSDLEGILKPDDNDVLHLPDVTITLAESGQFYLAGIDKKLLTLVGDTSGNAVTLDGDAGLTFTTSGGSSTITGITSLNGNSTSLAASQSMASAKQDKIIAGSNIQIAQDGKTISATDTNELENLTDVNITTPTDGQGLVYNNTTQKWENGTVSSASSIDTLTDVNLTNLTNGQILKYNSTSQEWENANESGGGGSGGILKGLDYANAVTLTLPDHTGYDYTPTGYGVLMATSYGGAGCITIADQNEDAKYLTFRDDTWTTPWVPVTKNETYHVSRGSSSTDFPSGSWFKFIPWLCEDGGGSGGSGDSFITYTKTVTTTNYGWWTVKDKDGNVLDPDEYIIVDISVTPYYYDVLWSTASDGGNHYNATLININDVYEIRSSTTYDWTITYAKKDFSSGGGGSSVTPNPQGTPTDTLSTIEIDGTIYDIEGSGGGISKYTEEVLWSGNESTSRWAEPIVLNIDITDYDMLSIRCGPSNEAGGVHIILTSEIPSGESSGGGTVSLGTFTENQYSIWLNKDNNILRIFTSTDVSINVKEVVGIKYGSGGGSGASAVSDLTDVDLTNLEDGQILKYDATNQKWINADEGGGGGDVELEETPLYTTPITVAGTYTLLDDIENYDFVSFVSGVSNEGDIRALIVSDILNMLDNNLVVNCAGTNGRWFNITALSGDQLSVTLATNPQTMIHSVMGYKIKGGSGGGGSGTYTSTLLNDGTAVQNVLTLSSDYTNFDELLITWMYDNNLYITTLKLNTSDISINDTITLDDYQTRNMVLTVTSTTAFTISSQASGMGILSIRGLTYSKTAKEKSRDVLWTTGSWTMAHPITGYDEIIFKWGSTHSTCFIPSDIMTYESFIVIDPDTNNFMWFDVTDASTFTVHQNNDLTITSIDGVVYTKDEPVVFAEEMTLSEYNELTTEEKNDGTIRFIPSENTITENFDMSQGSGYGVQSGMSFSATTTNVTSTYLGGMYIGGDWQFSTPIDVTNLTSIRFNLVTQGCYDHNNTNVEEQTTARFISTVYLYRQLPSGYGIDNEDSAIDMLKFRYTNTDYGVQEFDVSELTGEVYIVWGDHGWTATLSNITLIGGNTPSQIKYMDKTYADGSGGDSSFHTYSTTEQIVGTWIDGSNVYEKTISISNISLSSGSYETVDTVTGLDTIISCNGYIVEGNLKYTLNDITLRVIQDGTSVKFYSPVGTTWTISSGAIIIRYIKVAAS